MGYRVSWGLLGSFCGETGQLVLVTPGIIGFCLQGVGESILETSDSIVDIQFFVTVSAVSRLAGCSQIDITPLPVGSSKGWGQI